MLSRSTVRFGWSTSRCKGCGLWDLFRLGDIHGISFSLGLTVTSKDPAETLLPHSYLNINLPFGIATPPFRAPDDNVTIFEETGDDIEVFRIEKFHELVFAVSGIRFGTKDGENRVCFVGSDDWIWVDLRNMSLKPKTVDGMRRD